MQLGGDLNLYSPNRLGGKPRVKTGFKDATSAKLTLKNIAKYPLTYQKQVVITMYNRAKYHPHKTQEMQGAINVYSKWMAKHHIKYSSRTNKRTKKTNQEKKKINARTYLERIY
jgi:hypothetical protein